jgi:hypothetical protein
MLDSNNVESEFKALIEHIEYIRFTIFHYSIQV